MSLHRRLLQITSIIVTLTIIFSGYSMPSVSAQGNDGLKRQVNHQTGRVSFLGPESGRALPASQALGLASFARPGDPALALAKRFGSEFGLQNPERNLKEMKSHHHQTEDGRITARYQQHYQGVPVMGAELIVNTNDNGDLYSMNGEVSPDLSLSTQPTIDSEQARQSALGAVAKWYHKTTADFVTSEPELWIYDEGLLQPSTRPAELAWRMEVMPRDVGMPVRELVLVDAQRGSLSLHFNQIDTGWSSPREKSPAQAIQATSTPPPTETLEPVVTEVPTQAITLEQGASVSNTSISDVTTLTAVTWYVTTTGLDTNSCSTTGSPCKTINGAIGKAATGDTIKVAVGTYTGTGTEVVLISKSVSLSGGWNASFTTQSGTSTIDGQNAHVGVSAASTVTLDRFTIENGQGDFGGGIYNSGNVTITVSSSLIQNNSVTYSGGGIYNNNSGTLTLNNTTISNNLATYGGGISNGWGNVTLNNTTIRNNSAYHGGGIDNFGSFVLNNSTVNNNFSDSYAGGIYAEQGSLTLNNSTISNNLTNGYGGGIYQFSGSLILRNSTVSNNSANQKSGGISNSEYGTVTLQNSILARNTAVFEDPDCSGTIVSDGYNLIGNNSGFCRLTPTTGDLVGTSTNPINPRLGLLQDNGGSTYTQALMEGSQAIDAGNPAIPGSAGNACLATDQRGTARPIGARCDIGAFEGSVPWAFLPYVHTFTATADPQSLPGIFLCDQTDPTCAAGDSHAKAAHKYAIGTYNLYAAQFLRDSIDNAGMLIKSTVHYCDPDFACPYDNAFWSGDQMVYGDAYGYPLADDVVAHELTHGVTQHESNLFYYYQSGAINESFSDLWGEYYDQTNGLGNDSAAVKWLHAEDVIGRGPYRSMINPPTYGDPDKMSSPNYYEGEGDNGGVHFNSGINNKAVYLMVDGDTFNGKTVTGLGWTKTAAIYYEVNTNLLSSGADYSDLYYALQQACSNLIGQKGITSGDCAEVKDALDAVEMNGQPAPNFNADAPYCNAGNTMTALFSDDLESGTANWAFTNGAYPRWQVDSPYYGPFAQSGPHSLYADDYPAVITDAKARLASLLVPPNAYLRFAQAYDFETSDAYYDGGILEYSLNNGSTWVDAGSLIDFNGYKGTIFTGAGNPLSGHSAFVGVSHGYISTRLNLASLAGQTVSFRWRMGLDQAAFAGGWWVDNIKVYSCTVFPPAAFNKSAPANGGAGIGLSTTLSWASSSFADYYQYCYDLVNDNQCNRTWSAPINATSADIANLGTNTTYYWQVRAVNGGGSTSANNQTWGSFTTTSTLPAGLGSIETFIGTTKHGKYSLGSGKSLRESFSAVNNGPVKLASTNAVPFIGAERVIYNVNSLPTSFSEMMALPNSQLDNTYWLPWYNNVDLDTQLRFGNVSDTPAMVQVFIGGQEKSSGCTTTPANVPYPYILAVGASLRVSCPTVNSGPVRIVSDVNIVAAERVIYKINNLPTSFTEMMGLPDSQLNTTYWMPWYNNIDLDSQLRFGVP